jgi:membrane-bound metal-dependent hydrolase YbcI (DUF457 family)
MNPLNHFLFAAGMCLIFLGGDAGLLRVAVFSMVFGVLIDLDHAFGDKPWHLRRTWLQELGGFLVLGLPLALVLSRVNGEFFILVSVPYISHILLDYLCVFEARPLAPFSGVKKKEGLGIFIPDDLYKSANSKRWKRRAKAKKLKGISENYFTLILAGSAGLYISMAFLL